jgi:hypothetical protein
MSAREADLRDGDRGFIPGIAIPGRQVLHTHNTSVRVISSFGSKPRDCSNYIGTNTGSAYKIMSRDSDARFVQTPGIISYSHLFLAVLLHRR